MLAPAAAAFILCGDAALDPAGDFDDSLSVCLLLDAGEVSLVSANRQQIIHSSGARVYIQGSAERLANLAKQDQGRARQKC